MSHLNTRMPTGNDTTQRGDMKPAFSNDLFEQMLQPENFQQAWQQVRANQGAAGVDGMSIDDFPEWVKSGMGAGKGRSEIRPLPTSTGSACGDQQTRWGQASARHSNGN